MRKLTLLILLAACSSSEDKSAGPARCFDAGTIDTGADGSPDGRVGANLGPDASPDRLPEALTADCLPLDTGSLDAEEKRKADLAQAQDVLTIDADPLDSGLCGFRQILVNGACQFCGSPGLRCCTITDKCGAQGICLGESGCFRCGDLGGMCCDGNTCITGICKTGVCQ